MSACYDLSSSSQLYLPYLPSRVQSPGSFEQKSLITRPSVLSSCSWIQLHWMSNSCCGERSNQAVSNLYINLNLNQFSTSTHIQWRDWGDKSYLFIFPAKRQGEISCTDTKGVECFQVLKHVARLCKPVILCQSSSSQLYFTLPSSVTRLFWVKEPYNSAFCLVIMQLDSTWLDVKFMLRRTQQPSSQQFIHQFELKSV